MGNSAIVFKDSLIKLERLCLNVCSNTFTVSYIGLFFFSFLFLLSFLLSAVSRFICNNHKKLEVINQVLPRLFRFFFFFTFLGQLQRSSHGSGQCTISGNSSWVSALELTLQAVLEPGDCQELCSSRASGAALTPLSYKQQHIQRKSTSS